MLIAFSAAAIAAGAVALAWDAQVSSGAPDHVSLFPPGLTPQQQQAVENDTGLGTTKKVKSLAPSQIPDYPLLTIAPTAPALGITPAHQGPLNSEEFLFSSSGTVEVNSAYYTAYAGVTMSENQLGMPASTPALLLYQDASSSDSDTPPVNLGTFVAPCGSGPLNLTATSGGVIDGQCSSGAPVAFNVATRSF